MIQLPAKWFFLSELIAPVSEYSIDIGSTTTRVISGGRLIYNEPSCVAIHTASGTAVALGSRAYTLLGKHSKQLRVVFPIQRGILVSQQDIELYLTALQAVLGIPRSLRRLAVGVGGAIGLISKLTAVQQDNFYHTLRATGFGRLKVVPKPTAIYLQRRLSKADSDGHCLLDVGGQVTEVSVFAGGELAASTVLSWGGVNLTQMLQEQVRAEHGCALGWQVAEEAKKHLACISTGYPPRQKEQWLKTKYAVRGKDLVSQTAKTLVLSAASFDTTNSEYFLELADQLREFFAQLPTELAASVLERGVYLSGGGSKVRGFKEAVTHVFKCEVHTIESPELDVVEGLAKSLHRDL